MRHDVLAKAAQDPRSTPARILDAAEEAFAEHGYAGASTREIARRARVPFGALHYHWGSKRHLWDAVLTRLAERTRETVMRNLVPGATPGEILDNMTDAFLELLVSNRNATRLGHRMALERNELYVPSVTRMMRELADFGLETLRASLPGVQLDGAAAILVLANAFTGAVADEEAQQAFLGGSVFTSRPARERLRAELKRLARAVFKVE
jgi:AcrR family transcriptional regulator